MKDLTVECRDDKTKLESEDAAARCFFFTFSSVQGNAENLFPGETMSFVEEVILRDMRKFKPQSVINWEKKHGIEL